MSDTKELIQTLRKRGNLPFGPTSTCEEAADALEAMSKDAELWKSLYRRAMNQANGLTNYVEDRPELRDAERKLAAIEAEARAAIAEEAKSTRAQRMREAGYTRRPSAKSLPSDE